MPRTIRNSRVNPRKVDEDDAYNQAVTRGDQVDTAQREPKSGPVRRQGNDLNKATGK